MAGGKRGGRKTPRTKPRATASAKQAAQRITKFTDVASYSDVLRKLDSTSLQEVMSRLTPAQQARVQAIISSGPPKTAADSHPIYALPAKTSEPAAKPEAKPPKELPRITQRVDPRLPLLPGEQPTVRHLVSGTVPLDPSAPTQEQIPKAVEVKRAKTRRDKPSADELDRPEDFIDPAQARTEYYMDGVDRMLLKQFEEMPPTKTNFTRIKEIAERVLEEQARAPNEDIVGPYARVLRRMAKSNPTRFVDIVEAMGYDPGDPKSYKRFQQDFGPERARRPAGAFERPELEDEPPLDKQRQDYEMPPRVIFGTEIGKKFEPSTSASGVEDSIYPMVQQARDVEFINSLLQDMGFRSQIFPQAGRKTNTAEGQLITRILSAIEGMRARGAEIEPRQYTDFKYRREFDPIQGQFVVEARPKGVVDEPQVAGPYDTFEYSPGVANIIRQLLFRGEGDLKGLAELGYAGRGPKPSGIPYTLSTLIEPRTPDGRRLRDRKILRSAQKRDNQQRELLMEFVDGRRRQYIPDDLQDYRKNYPFLIDRETSELIDRVSRKSGIFPLDRVLQGLRINVPYKDGNVMAVGRMPSEDAAKVLSASRMTQESFIPALQQLIAESRQIYERLPPHPTEMSSKIAKNLEGKTVLSGDNVARINAEFARSGQAMEDVVDRTRGPRFFELSPDQQAEMLDVLERRRKGSGAAYQRQMEQQRDADQITPDATKGYLKRIEATGGRSPSAAVPQSILYGLMV